MIGILALQGDIREHCSYLLPAFPSVRAVKKTEDLTGIDGLIIPGGESTAMTRLIRWSGIEEPVRRMIGNGLPVWGTCAGAILLCRGGIWECIDAGVERNAYGPQAHSCVKKAFISGSDRPIPMVFIRAPRIINPGPDAIILSRAEGDIVALRKDNVLISTFHPELTDDPFFLSLFTALVRNGRGDVRSTCQSSTEQGKAGVTPLIYAES